MIPALLARDVETGLQQFLTTAYEPSDAFFHGVMKAFVADAAGWLKGPYLQLGLPFRKGALGTRVFESFELPFPGYAHQEAAWLRLKATGVAGNTLVATGTGSGKTECFMYPVLDHAARARAVGQQGIKAMVIYPMNALASDQARRFAQAVAAIPAFRQLRVGMYVGGGAPGEGSMVMSANAVITDRDTLRKAPPDVLLTNYKMLDYLLIRPKDRQLWQHNAPDTLRFVVVDELHTFDGAQGTDLALLLRRLRARLQAQPDDWVCVGTSATLGGGNDSTELRDYARQVFSTGFPENSVVLENRVTTDEFLDGYLFEYALQWRPGLEAVLSSVRERTQADAVRKAFEVMFPESYLPRNFGAPEFRAQLGGLLKSHLLFVNLLRCLKGGLVPLQDLYAQLPMPERARPHAAAVVDALLVLVAWARDPAGYGRPLVTQRLQLWVRELRRMVAKLAVDKTDVRLRAATELRAQADGICLPLLQCTECHATCWLSVRPEVTKKISTALDEIYNAWFTGSPDVVRLYPGLTRDKALADGVDESLCCSCGNLQPNAGKCQACGRTDLVSVFRAVGTVARSRGDANFTFTDKTCPCCSTRDRLILIGARNATLGAIVVEQSWASPFNDDKKLIAFSDSVQDAAHRAGFFAARTYMNTVRTAIGHVLRDVETTAIPWAEFLERLAKTWLDEPEPMSREHFVSEFIGPNLTWQKDWVEGVQGQGLLPARSRLPARVAKRLAWQAFAEFTYMSQRGRSLDRIALATLLPDPSALESAADAALPVFIEEFGLRGLSRPVVLQWLWGFVLHLKHRGAVTHPELDRYMEDANLFGMLRSGERGEWMPTMGSYTPHPSFLTLGAHRHFDRIAVKGRQGWYQRWLSAALGRDGVLLPERAEDALYGKAIELLARAGVLQVRESASGRVVGVDASSLSLRADVVRLVGERGSQSLALPRAVAETLLGMPCIDVMAQYYEHIDENRHWLADRFTHGDLRRVIAAEHTGLLERDEREQLETRFKAAMPQPWYENLLSATPTLEMGVDIGDLSSAMLCSVPPNQASYLQRVGRAGRRDGNAFVTTLADGGSPHDLYFFDETMEMMAGAVSPPGVFLGAAEVLKRQLFAYCLDAWVASGILPKALPEKTSEALNAVERAQMSRFPYTFLEHVNAHAAALLEGFLALLGSDCTEEVRARLTDFFQGTGDDDGLAVRLHKVLGDLNVERGLHQKRVQALKAQIDSLQAKPQDDATREEIGLLRREREAVLSLITEINKRDLLGTLTDHGLIPNYAFPESGIELKSVLWRRRGSDEEGQGAYVSLPAIKYERPASSALSEFAPENRFYANQRRVEVDQINMQMAKLEYWRLCPSCHHMQNLQVQPAEHPACPRCGDAMWSNSAQRRQLLRFRQAIANSDDTKVRIDDAAEDREPKYYTRQMLVDFEAKDVRDAWKVSGDATPFGFEFISRAVFRDVNFGAMGRRGQAEAFKVADLERERPGFRLCAVCGKVQKPLREHDDEAAEAQHAYDCTARSQKDGGNVLDSLYLYREFASEALRILVPFTHAGVDDEVVQSFMAALQLGLKKRFAGKVDHLRVALQDEPGRDGGPRRHYVLVYDSVPGGTGYLDHLLKVDAVAMREVLTLARDAMAACRCHEDPHADGCYRCLYQYRLGRAMEKVSRNRATEVLNALLAAMENMERVPTISEIFVNPQFDSALEARFIEALRRLSGTPGMPVVQLAQTVMPGKTGFILQVGDAGDSEHRYEIEPQVDLGPEVGVAVQSRPDFVIRPRSARSGRRPIAVFCDGWAYHKDSTRADGLKRSAIVASGRYWVLSVTHHDVESAIAGDVGTQLESPLVSHARHDGARAPASLPRATPETFQKNAVAFLLAWLAGAADDAKGSARELRARDWAWATYLMVPPPEAGKDARARFDALQAKAPVWIAAHKPAASVVALGKDGASPEVALNWPMAWATGVALELVVPQMLLFDDRQDRPEDVRQRQWRNWLRLYNWAQFIPGAVLGTHAGLEAGEYDVLQPVAPAPGAAPPVTVPATGGGWAPVIASAVSSLHAGLHALAEAAAPAPDEVGYEWSEGGGKVALEAELAWVQRKVVLLVGPQAEYALGWQAEGWVAITAEGDWVPMLLSSLNAGEA